MEDLRRGEELRKFPSSQEPVKRHHRISEMYNSYLPLFNMCSGRELAKLKML